MIWEYKTVRIEFYARRAKEKTDGLGGCDIIR